LDWGNDAEDEEDDDEDDEKPKAVEKPQEGPPDKDSGTLPDDRDLTKKKKKKAGRFDIMAQQLKFIACLQILMEELGTLATGCEVDGGQLRFQLYVWLEREVHALRHLCNYNEDVDEQLEKSEDGGT
jgi:hypothetical protein